MKLQFPKDFKFGVADADLQVVGERFAVSEEQSSPTMWTHFAKNSHKVFNNDTPEPGIDRYHRWEEDVELMKAMGAKHFRTSVSMARLMNPDGTVNSSAATWYINYFKALKKADITTYATLYHWELPMWLFEKGGWLNRETSEVLAKHATLVAETLGEYIDEYFLFNEPWCAAILSYFHGNHAPGEQNTKHALEAAHNILLGIGLSHQALEKIDKNLKISTVFNTEPAYANSADPKDILAAKYADGYFNRWFMDPIYIGKYPEDMLELYGSNVPKFTKEEMNTIKIGNKLHAFGHNYYCGKIVEYDPEAELKFKVIIRKEGETNDLGWPIFQAPTYPDGLYDMLSQVYFSYKNYGLKRIYIPENGMALESTWDGKSSIVRDARRIDYYTEHLRQVYKAIQRGIPVEAYFAWTIMDNYEWAEGYREESRFGLIYVDRKSMKRVWKESAHWYKDLIRTNSITVPENKA
ncbi:MAG: hypothetical protein RLZZ455_281 [Candidatus Parcubacteria bacterium]|jgi:beta-glucosidase